VRHDVRDGELRFPLPCLPIPVLLPAVLVLVPVLEPELVKI
jgi:hypothetical protein